MMSNRTVIIYGGELYHHGILGMKWGKKNGPPYPLDAEDHSASEKKAGWKKSLVSRVRASREAKNRYKLEKSNIKYRRQMSRNKILNDEDREMSKIAEKYRPGQTMSDEDLKKEKQTEDKYTKKWHENETKYKNDLKNAKAVYREEMKKAHTLSDKQKIALTVGAAVAVAGLAAYGTYKVSKSNYRSLLGDYAEELGKGEGYLHTKLEAADKDRIARQALKGGVSRYYEKIDNPFYASAASYKNKLDKNLYNRIVMKGESISDLDLTPSATYYYEKDGDNERSMKVMSQYYGLLPDEIRKKLRSNETREILGERRKK